MKVRRLRVSVRPFSWAYVAWGELLFYTVGIAFVYTGILHAYFSAIVAPGIGWQPSPFEYELGWLEIPVGVVAIASLWRGYDLRLATTVLFATFGLAAAAQHIAQIVCCANWAPSNAGFVLWFADITLPLLAVALAVAASRTRT